MKLTKYFNLNFLIQNLKKSKVVLSIFIGLIPILNTIIEIMILSIDKTEILSFGEISALTLLGAYFLPIIISICLFNYVYKKNSVDFINSMPISRKSIFITNTVLGIIIITSMLLINAILTLLVCLILNRPIPLIMLLEYFSYFSLVYFFIFITTNLAMTISGNAITQVIVTLLLLFLMPYISIFTNNLSKQYLVYDFGYNNRSYIKCTTKECLPDEYYCYDNEKCLSKQKNDLYKIMNLKEINENIYTAPFAFFTNQISSSTNKTNIISILKMIILSIIYIILGNKLFKLRKMEVSETSFKNIHHHNIVKSLTLIPIATIAYYLLKGTNLITTIFIVIIMIIYFLVYDLLVKKHITNLKLTAIYFVITIITTVGTCYLIEDNAKKELIIDHKNITSIAIDLNYTINSYNEKIVYINNQELINLIIKSGLKDYSKTLRESNQTYNYDDAYYTYITMPIYLKTKDNKQYQTYISLDEKTYKEVLKILDKEELYIDNYKSLNNKNIYAVKIGNKLYTKEETSKILETIETAYKNISLEEYIRIQDEYIYNDYYIITLYSYENHDKRTYTITGYISNKLLNAISNNYNQELSNDIPNIIPEDYYIYHEESYLNNTYNMDYYVLKSSKNEIYEFILKNKNDKVDITKEYFKFSIEINKQKYIFTTNKTDEIKNILEDKYLEIKNTKEYQDYNNNDNGDRYYD